LGSAKLVILAIAAVAALELVAWATRSFLPDFNVSLVDSPDGRAGEAVVSLVESAVAVGATLLGLYYATVGVIASTIYKSVRGDVRDLFISERNSEN
jgi:alpha-D-ribose 1-methylphosphonate 5-triphosphate synthase subunit PhnL